MNDIRINKYISQCGYCSRREADRLIADGKVQLNGAPASMGMRVMQGDVVSVMGEQLVPDEPEIVLALHKPKGIVCTTSQKDPDNVIRFLDYPKRIYPVGRLDKDSTGLLFLTNNGQLMDDILRGSNYHEKEYKIGRAHV